MAKFCAERKLNMRLWLVVPKKEQPYNDDPWEKAREAQEGIIVEAATSKQARKMAAARAGSEGREAWLNPLYSTCQRLVTLGRERVVLRSFRNA